MYITAQHCTANEDGKEEVVLEEELGFHKWLMSAIKQHSLHVPLIRKEEWVRNGEKWVNKCTGEIADDDKVSEIYAALHDFGLHF